MSENPPDPERTRRMTEIAQRMTEGSPHSNAIGLEVVSIEGRVVTGRLQHRADLVGDPDTGVLAGGVLTVLLDHLCGMAVLSALEVPAPVATLDLRIDYMRPATPGTPLLAQAECYRVTRSVAFVRALAFEQTPDDPVASAAAAFMLVNGKRTMSPAAPP
jgi:uncharacterized protein (TIGR00369 family)